jgi:hypothetical protein
MSLLGVASAARLARMNRRLWLYFALFLSLALPLSGVVSAVELQKAPCPMQLEGVSQVGQMTRDCCDEQKSAHAGTKVCKSGEECKTSSLLQVLSVKAPLLVGHQPAVVSFNAFIPSPAPNGVWRPPRV